MENGDSEGNAPLLAAAQRLDVAMGRRQVEQVKEEVHLRFDESLGQFVDAPKVLERLLDGEFAVQGQLLRHVADARAGDPALHRAGLATKHQHFSAVEAAPADDAAQQCRLAAPAGSQQSVSAKSKK